MSDVKARRRGSDRPHEQEAPSYTPPRVILYSEEALLERLGPAKACASFPLFNGARNESDPPAGEKRLDFKL